MSPATAIPAPVPDPIHEKGSSRRRTWLLAGALWLLTLVLYWPATRCEFVNYDDDRYVTDNPAVKQGLTADSIRFAFLNPVCDNWHPLTLLSHMLDCQLYGLNPWGHHLTNLLLHALNAVLVFLLLRQLTGTLWRSATVAALFAWHPLRVESVAWIAERKDVLSVCFGLLSLAAYIHYVRRQEERVRNPEAAAPAFYRSRSYWLAWFFLCLGLLSKPVLVTWPFVMLLLDYWPLQRLQPSRRRQLLVETAPFFALAAVFCAVTYAVHRATGDMKAMASLPFAACCENALVSYCRYLGKTFWPADLAVFYPHPGHWPLADVFLAALLLCGITAGVTVVSMVRRNQLYLPMGWYWFLGTLLPVIGLVQVGHLALADRHTYLPSLGLAIVVVWSLHAVSIHWRRRTLALSLMALAALALCFATTRHQLRYWQNSETLFRHNLAVTGDNDVADYNLGLVALAQGQSQTAMDLFRRAIRARPAYAEAHNNLAILLSMQGQTNSAIQEFEITLLLASEYADAHFNYGKLLAECGRPDAALIQFLEAARLAPRDPEVHWQLGSLFAQAGKAEDALDQFQQVVRLKPDSPDAHYKLAQALLKSGRLDPAIAEFQTVIRLSTKSAPAHYYLAVALAQRGRTDQAAREFQETIRLKPNDAAAHEKLGIVLGDNGHLAEAIGEFETALQLNPNYTEASNNLARARALGREPKPGAP